MSDDWQSIDLANPTEEHTMLRSMIRKFVAEEVEPQALEYDREEKFNLDLFRKLGEYGLLGISVPEEYGGSGMDATAVAIVNEELSYSDPGFCLAYLAHAQLMVNNLAHNGNEAQKTLDSAHLLPRLAEAGVTMTTQQNLQAIEGRDVVSAFVWGGPTRRVENVDTIVVAMLRRSVDSIYHALEGKVPERHLLGDALAPRKPIQLMYEAEELGRAL